MLKKFSQDISYSMRSIRTDLPEAIRSISNQLSDFSEKLVDPISNIFTKQSRQQQEKESLELVLSQQAKKIQELENKVKSYEGEYTVVDGKRVYSIEEDASVFHNIRHRNLGGLVLQEVKKSGLNVSRTTNRNQSGDFQYSTSCSDEDNAILGQVFAKLQAKYNPENK